MPSGEKKKHAATVKENKNVKRKESEPKTSGKRQEKVEAIRKERRSLSITPSIRAAVPNNAQSTEQSTA